MDTIRAATLTVTTVPRRPLTDVRVVTCGIGLLASSDGLKPSTLVEGKTSRRFSNTTMTTTSPTTTVDGTFLSNGNTLSSSN